MDVGVPQGSVISPTLFTVMINDLFHGCSPKVKYSLFADDGAMWTTAEHLNEGIAVMQEAVNAVSQWSQRWGLQLAAAKTKVVIFTKR